MASERNSPADCFADITWTGFAATVPEAVQAVFNVAAAARDGAVAFANARMQAGEPVHGYEIDEHARIITAAAMAISSATAPAATAWAATYTTAASTSTT
ncbi:MAG: hypothetical protein R2838_21195 [Caldilineaceae bacterium]